ncbi:MAG: DUF3006 domain-containing protein [Blastocatellia bacterium]
MTEKTSSKVVIDRMEDDLAVIVMFDDDSVQFNLPVKYLPETVKEGDHLQMNFSADKESRQSQKQKVADLLKELTDKKD